MPSLSKNNATAAKALAMYGKRLTTEDYQKLLSCSSTKEIADYLKTKTCYSECFAATSNSTELSDETVKQLINQRCEDNVIKLSRYTALIGDDLFKITVTQSDIECILCAIRLVISPTTRDNLYTPDDFSKKRSKLNHTALYNATSAVELVSALQGTPYQSVVKAYTDVQNNTFELAQIEAKLTEHLYSVILNRCKSKGAKKDFSEIIKLNTDKFNLSTIYRFKKYSQRTSEQVFKFVSKGGTLPMSKLKQLCDAKDSDEFLAVLETTKFSKVVTKTDLDYIEGALDKVIITKYKKYLKQSTNPDVQVFSYLQFARNEVHNILKILEGKKYGLAESDISQLLIT